MSERLAKNRLLDRIFHQSQWDKLAAAGLKSLYRFDRDDKLQGAEISYYLDRVERDRELIDIGDRLQGEIDARTCQNLQLRQQELLIATEREGDRISELYRDYFELKRSSEIDLQLTQMQIEWDRDTWFSKLSRQETELIRHRHRQRLLMLAAPPKLDRDRQLKLWKNIDFDLKMRSVGDFLARHYPSHDRMRPVRFYSNYFRESIGDLDAERLHRLLSPIATYIIYCDIEPQTMSIRIAHWGVESQDVRFLPPIVWDWQAERGQLIDRGESAVAADRAIVDVMVNIYQVLTAYLADVYYLNLIPHYRLQLDRAVEDLELDKLASLEFLTDLRQHQQQQYYRELADLTRHQQQQQAYDAALLKQQLAAEIQRREEIESKLPAIESDPTSLANIPKLISFFVVNTDKRGEIIGEEIYRSPCITFSLGNGINLEFMSIPAGEVTIGDREVDTEKPLHQVNIAAFNLGKYPITQAQYHAITGDRPAYFIGENRPVERISWWDALRFCRRLAVRIDRPVRLPSEAEWEYACRAHTDTPFYFGEGINLHLANYYRNTNPHTSKLKNRQQTTNVGSYPPNAFGLYDLHGNVAEWCYDTWHDNYAGAPTDGTAWITTVKGKEGDAHVLRGGSWYYSERACRSSSRDYCAPDYSSYHIGFRVVLG